MKKNVNGSFVIPTLLAGGSGSRLWPVSREQHPKPFIRLEDGQNLLQKTFLRALSLPNVSEVMTVINRDLFFLTKDSYHEVNTTNVANSFLLEPFGRNTAPAIAAAALYTAKQHGGETILLVLPADHIIEQAEAFQQAVAKAVTLAERGKLVTFGIKPTAPKTGFGYIEVDGNDVLRFTEKPSAEIAETYLASGKFLWNSGMFCFSANTILDEMRIHCPTILNGVEQCIAQSCSASGTDFTEHELNPELFNHIENVSIDYAVIEKSTKLAVIPCDIGWNDIGSWFELGDLTTADRNGNRVNGEAILQKVHDCTIHANERLVGAIGIDNLIIIDTDDAILIAHKNEAQGVKKIYEQLKTMGHESHKLHTTVHRPWGTYTVLEQNRFFKIKRIAVKPGAALSLQMHQYRSEHWVVISGSAKVINGDKKIVLNANESTFIPANNKHRLANPNKELLVIIEIQCGEYLGEDDITRFEDCYGRPTSTVP